MFDWLASKFRRPPTSAALPPRFAQVNGDIGFEDTHALDRDPATDDEATAWAPTVPASDEPTYGGGARDESERRSLALLQARGLSALQYVAETAARICDTPIAAVSMADGELVWFQAVVGVRLTQLPRAATFCDRVIAGMPAMLVVPDALEDARFADLPMVQAPPHVRFYAGAPFATPDGVSMGVVSVADTVPRVLTPVQLRTLQLLARQTAMLLDARTRADVPGQG